MAGRSRIPHWLRGPRKRKSKKKSPRYQRRNSQIEQLEPRQMLTVDSPVNEPLLTAADPLEVQLTPVDSNTSVDLLALGSNGDLTVALNRGNDTWESSQSIDLGLGPLHGLNTGLFNADLFPDLVIQGPDSLSIAIGDGNGGFTVGQTIAAATPGSFAPTGDGRVGLDVSFLNNDLIPDVVAVAPGTDEVLIFSGLGNGTIDAPIAYSSGADEPLVAIAGDFIGDRAPDIAVGHADGSLTFLEGAGDGTFLLRNDLTIGGLGTITDLATDDFDGDGDADLAVTGGSQAQLLLQDADPLAAPVIVNGNFSQGLTGWTTEIVGEQAGDIPGTINAQNGFAQLTENQSFLVTLKQSFVVPDNPQTVEFDLLSLGLEDPGGGVPDALEVSLLNASQQSLVPTHRPEATSFFNATPGASVSLGSGASFDGTKVTLDISSLTPGVSATLLFDLVGNPAGDGSVATIDNVQVTPVTVLSETFTAVPLPGPFTNAQSVTRGDVDGDGSVDIVVSDGGTDELLVFNGDGAGGFVRSVIDLSTFGTGAAAVTTGLLTAGNSADDIAVLLANSDLVVTPLLADFDAPSPMFTSPAPGEVVTDALSEFTIHFSEPVQDNGPAGNNSVTNSAAYTLSAAGADGNFGTSDDQNLPITTVSYNAATNEATVTIDPAALPLADGSYQLTVNGSDPALSLLDVAGNPLMGGTDAVLSFSLNTPPQITSLSSLSGDEGASLAFLATFVDPGFQDSRTATIDWGDGTSSVGVVDEVAGTITADHAYADDGSYTVTLTLTDAAGNSVSDTTTATISNVAPQLTAAASQSATVGEALSVVLATFLDNGFDNSGTGTQENFSATIDWGDGSPIEAGTLAVTPGSEGVPTTGTISGVHVYNAPGPNTVTITIEDDDGGADSVTLLVTVAPSSTDTNVWLPAIDFETDAAGNPLSAGESIAEQWSAWGVHVTTHDPANHPAMIFDSANPTGGDSDLATTNQQHVLILSEDGDSSDPDDNASGGTLIFTFDNPVMLDEVDLLDIDESGTTIVLFDDSGAEIANVAAANLGDNSQQTVTLDATDVTRMEIRLAGSGAVTNVTFCRDIHPGDFVTLSGASSSNEGETYALELASSADIVEWTINWNDGSPLETVSGAVTSAQHEFADGDQQVAIRATATDSLGNIYLSDTLSVQVNNVAPLLSISGPATVEAGTTYTLNLSSDDPGADTISHWIIDWGDGSPLEEVLGNPPSVDHVYGLGPNTYTIEALAFDEDNSKPGDFAEDNGLVVVEVENFSTSTAGTGSASGSVWTPVADGGVSGGTYFEATPNTGVWTGDNLNGPRLDYDVHFTTPGTYYVWVLMNGSSGSDDSVHVGLDEQAATLGNYGLTDGSGTWHWEDKVTGRSGEDRVTIEVGEAGLRTLNLWMREDGVRVDKILLTADANFTPTGLGPAETTGTNNDPYVSNQLTVDVMPGQNQWLPTINLEAAADGRPLQTGEVIAEQWAALGVHVTTHDPANHPAMIFDSVNPTGGDQDLATLDQQKILILSEDGDATDPDDNGSGGTFIFTFDNPVMLDEVGLLDIEESGGHIRLFDASSNLISDTGILPAGNNAQQTVALDAVGVARMEIHLAGSGAVTNVVFCREGHSIPVVTPATRFFVVDGSTDRTFRYTDEGALIGTLDVDGGAIPRGATTKLTDDNPLWVVKSNEWVYVYDTSDDSLLGSWDAADLDWARGIATDGTDIWIVDANYDRIYRYDGGASLRSGSHTADFSFALASGNYDPSGVTTDGARLWVTDRSTDKMFVYDMAGGLLGSWQLDSANSRASGVTLDAAGDDLWVTDYDDGLIYHYADATSQLSGSLAATSTIALAAGNARPEGIADPVFNINIGEVVAGSLATASDVDEYLFDVTSGQFVYLDIQAGGFPLSWTLSDPSGNVVVSDTFFRDLDTLELTATGEYTLSITASFGTDLAYQFQFVDVPAPTTTPIAIGDTVAGETLVIGEDDFFTFSGTASQLVYFEPLSEIPSNVFEWQVTDPSGNVLFRNSFNDVNTIALPETGQYTLEMDGFREQIGSYEFQTIDVPIPVPMPINVGDVINGDISVVGEFDLFTFNGSSGQELYIDIQQGSATTHIWTLEAPSGAVISSSGFGFGDAGPLSLPETGEYTFVVDGRDTRTEAYQFQLIDVPEPVTTPIALGEVVSGSISIQGEVDLYTFNATAGRSLFVDTQLGSPFLSWNLRDPAGTSVASSGFFTDSSGTFGNLPLIDLSDTGEYTFVVDGDGDRREPYQFQIFDSTTPPVQPIALNTDVAGTMSPQQTLIYTFEGVAGQELIFDVQLTEASAFTLLDPSATEIVASTTQDQLLANLAATGTYSVVITQSNPVDTDSRGDFQFRVQEKFTPPQIGVQDSQGTEFWMAFPSATTNQTYTLFVSAEQQTQVIVEVPNLGFFATTTIAAEGVAEIVLPPEVVMGRFVNDIIENKGVHLLASGEVTVQALFDGQFSSDAYLGLPVDALGTEHLIVSYPSGCPLACANSEFTVVATENNTQLTITPTINIGNFGPTQRPADVPYDILLDRGETYRISGGSFVGFTDLTGTSVVADKPIFVLGGNQETFVPVEVGQSDFIYEQMPSVDTWGRRFVTFPLGTRVGGDTFRILAARDNTVVNINGAVAATLNRGEFHEQIIDGPAEITSDEPLLVVQYSNGTRFDGLEILGDPFMLQMPPVEQFRSAYSIQVPDSRFDPNLINVVAPEAAIGTITLNGATVDVSEFTPIGSSGFSGAALQVVPGAYRLEGALPFGVIAYGFEDAGSYGYTGGTALAPVALVASLEATPEVASVLVGSQHTVTSTVTDQLGQPIAGVRVDLNVTGANPTQDFGFTDAAGQVVFAYAGANLGTDTIDLSIGTITDTITADWITAAPFIQVTSPTDGAQFAEGSTTLITGRALPGPSQGKIVAVLIDGLPVDTVDIAGNFFTTVPITSGSNTFTLEAFDQFGETATTIVTLEGVSAGTITSAALSEDATLAASLSYANTTFNRATGILHADVRLTNNSEAPLAGPIQAAYDPFRPVSVTLANGDGTLDDGAPFVAFDTELPATGLAVGATSAAMALEFANGSRERFDFDVALVGLGNRAPSITSPPVTEALTGTDYTYQPVADDPDGNAVSFRLEAAPTGMVLNSATQQVEWTPVAGQEGNHRVVLVADDGLGGVARQTFQVRLRDSATNRPPRFTSPPLTQISSGTDYDYTPTTLDPDGQTVTYVLETAPAGAAFDTATGRVTIASPADGTFTIAIRASDGIDSEVQEFVVRVGAGSVNANIPVFESTPPTEAVVDSLYFYQPVATDDDGDTLTYSLLTAPTGVSFDSATGRITWTPEMAQLGPQPVLLTVSDGNGGIASQSFTIDVADVPANEAPVIDSAPSLIATQDLTYEYTVEATDPEGAAVTYQLVAGPTGMVLNPTTGELTWTPSAADVGTTVTVQIHANDPLLLPGVQTYQLEVRATNTAPTFTSDPLTEIAVGEGYRYQAIATDAEDGVTYTLETAPTGMTIGERTGRLFWNPDQLDLGDNPIVIRATDDRGLSADQNFTLTVSPDTEAPQVLVDLQRNPITIGETIRIEVRAQDNVAVSDVTLTIDGVEQTLDATQGILYTATAGGLPEIVATATDNSGNVGTGTAELRIFDPADTEAPFVEIASPAADGIVTYLTDVLGTVTDDNLEFYRLQVSPAGLDEWKTFAEGNTNVTDDFLGTFDPTMLASDIYDVRVFAQDVNGLQTFEQISLSVEGQAKLGNFRLEFNDLTIPLAGVPIEINRVYDTLDAARSGDFGYGWMLGLQTARIRETVRLSDAEAAGAPALFGGNPFRTGTRVYLNTPDGRRVGFTFDPIAEPGLLGTVFKPRFTPDPGVFEQLEVDDIALSQNADGTFGLYLLGGFAYNPSEYTLVTKDQVRYRYDQFDDLQDITDRNGNTLTYTDAGIFSSTGESIDFVRDAQGRITEIVDPAGNSMLYTYDASGNLTSFTDQAGVASQYTYKTDPIHYLDEVVNPRGNLISRSEYDETGRVISIADAQGNTISQAYDLANNTEVITDREGNETTLIFDDRGNITEEIDPLGNMTFYAYDSDDNEIEITDARGFTTFFSYDNRGNSLLIEEPGRFTRFEYDAFNNVTKIIGPFATLAEEPNARVAEFVYDERGNLIERVDAAGNSHSMTVDQLGRMITSTDERGNTTEFEFADSSPEPSKVTYPDLTFETFTYDRLLNLTSHINELGVTVATILYDFAGRPIEVQGAEGQVRSFHFSEHLPVQETIKISETESSVRAYQYAASNAFIGSTLSNGGVIALSIDGNDDVVELTDPVGNTSTFELDGLGRPVKKTNALGEVTTFTYDQIGNLTSTTNPLGETVVFQYDALNRQVVEEWFAANGALVNTISLTYDIFDNLTSASDSTITYAYSYNSLDYLVSASSTGLLGSPAITLTYDYDSAGNRIRVADDTGVTVDSEYGSRNQLISKTWHGGTVDGARIEFGYDSDLQLNEVRRYSDATGTNQMGTSTYTYDNSGRHTQIAHLDAVDSVFSSYEYEYDLANQITRQTIDGNVVDYTYDINGQLTAANYADATFADESYSYDLNGNRTDSHLHSTAYTIGTNNQLLSDGEFQYSYDNAANLISKTNVSSGDITTYEYDHRGHMTRAVVTSPSGIATMELTFVYDPFGRRIAATTDTDGASPISATTEIYAYDGDNVWADYDSSGQVLAQYLFGDSVDTNLARWKSGQSTNWYLTDHLGTVRVIADSAGDVINRIEYDTYGRILSESSPSAGDRYKFTGREWISGIDLYYYRARHYDPKIGRFTSEDTISFAGRDPNLYRYVQNAPTLFTDPSGNVSINDEGFLVENGVKVGSSTARTYLQSWKLHRKGIQKLLEQARQIGDRSLINAHLAELAEAEQIIAAANATLLYWIRRGGG